MFRILKPEKKKTEDPGISKTGVSAIGLKGTAKSAISFIPFAGSAINTMIEEAKNAKDNEDAKKKIVEEIKYTILLIESTNNLINYISIQGLTTQLCDVKIISDMRELSFKIINILKDLRKDPSINIQTNYEIEKIIIDNFSKQLHSLQAEQREKAISYKKTQITTEFCKKKQISDVNAIEQVEIINSTQDILNYAKLLLNTRELLGKGRMFFENNENKIYLSLEDFLNECGFAIFSDAARKKSLDKIYKSNVVKYLQNREQIDNWITTNPDIFNAFKSFPAVGNTPEETINVFILHLFLLKFISDPNRSDKTTFDDNFHLLFQKMLSVQKFLLNIDTVSYQILMQALNDPIEVQSQIDVWERALKCTQAGIKPPETRSSARDLFSKIIVASDFVNIRNNLNIVSSQLNSLYQDLIFQVLQLRTINPAHEKLLCPSYSLEMFK